MSSFSEGELLFFFFKHKVSVALSRTIQAFAGWVTKMPFIHPLLHLCGAIVARQSDSPPPLDFISLFIEITFKH